MSHMIASLRPVPENVNQACVCNEGFTLCGGACWHFNDEISTSLSSAQQYCAGLGAQLAVPTSSEQNECAVCLTQKSDLYYTWLDVTGNGTLASFRGQDGEELTFKNWDPMVSDPEVCDARAKCHHCALLGAGGEWSPMPCDHNALTLCKQTECCAVIEGKK